MPKVQYNVEMGRTQKLLRLLRTGGKVGMIAWIFYDGHVTFSYYRKAYRKARHKRMAKRFVNRFQRLYPERHAIAILL